MAEKIKASNLIDKDVLSELLKVEKAIKGVTKSTADLMAVMQKQNEVLKQGAANQKTVADNVKKNEDNTRKLSDVEKEIQKIEEKHYQVLTKMVAARSEENKKLQEATEAIKKQKIEQDASIKSVNGLKAANKLLRQERDNLIRTDKDYKKNVEALNEKINANQKAIDETSDSEQKRRNKIGKYKEDIVKAYVAIQGALIVAKAAYNAVNNAIKENETTSEFLERKIGGLGAAFGVLKSYVYSAAESLISSNDESINWGNALRDVLSAISMGFSEFIPGIRKTGEEMNQASKEAEKLLRVQQDLADLEGEMILNRSISNRQIVESRDLYSQEGIELEKKREYLKTAIDLEAEQLQVEIDHQSKVVANLIAQGELKKKLKTFDVGREGLAIKQAEAKLQDLITESYSRTRRAKLNLKLVDKQIADEAAGKFSDASGNTWRASLDDWGKSWDKSTEDIEKKGEDSLKKMNDDIEKYNEEKVKSDKDAQDKIDATDEENHQKYLRRREAEKQAEEDIRDLKIGSINAVADIGFAFGDREIQNLEERKQKELDSAGDNAKKKEKIEADYAKKIGKIKQRQAVADKGMSLFNIFMSTRAAVMAIMAQLWIPFSVKATQVTWTKILGGLQAAAVLAQPIPKFFKGVTNLAKDTLGIVGDNAPGKSGDSFELVETPKNGMFLTPNRATEMLIPKGSTIHPHDKTVEMLKEMDSSKVNELIKEQKLTRKALANQVHHSTRIDERGARFLTQYGNSTTEWINKNFR